MELLQLMYFCESAKYENFSRVAEQFRVPVSGISSSIKRLEQELDTKLFVRTANRVKLSQQGKTFYEDVKRAMDILEESKKQLKNQKDSISGKIALAVFTNHNIINDLIVEFKKKYPDVIFEINTNQKYNTSSYDLIISDEMLYPKGCGKKAFLTDNLCLVVKKNHPLAQQQNIDIKSLNKEKFICTGQKSSIFHHTCRICYENGFVPEITMYVSSLDEMIKYIDAGCGIGIIPESGFDKNLYTDLVLKNIGDYKRNTCIYFEDNKIRVKVVELFLQELTNLAF